MASHFAIYRSVNAPVAIACSDDADLAAKYAKHDLPCTAVVVRMLAGVCDVCGKSVSSVKAAQPFQIEAVA